MADYEYPDKTGLSALSKEIFTKSKTELDKKVDKVSGKGLSTNDYTTTEKEKLSGIANNANNYTHPNSGVTAGTYKSVTVNAQGHVTAGTNPTTLSGYGITDGVKAESGKGLSTNDYTTAEKTKLAGLSNYTHPNSGVTAGTYKSVTVNAQGHVTAGTNPTTLTGYGITDAYTKSEVDTKTNTSTKSVSGNPVEFTTDSAQYARECVVNIEPHQDLHGYDHPWPAGGGKNFLYDANNHDKSTVESGLTITKNDDGTITLNGTATAAFLYYLSDRNKSSAIILPVGTYILSGVPTGYTSMNLRIGFNRGSSGETIANDTGSGVTFSESEGTNNYGIWIGGNAGTYSNVIIKPMIRKSTESSDFEPYSNICPITGSDSVNVKRIGKNLLKLKTGTLTSGGVTATFIDNGCIQVSGTNTTASNRIAINSEKIKLNKGSTYKFAFPNIQTFAPASCFVYARFKYTDGTNGYIYDRTAGGVTQLTLAQDAEIDAVYIYIPTANVAVSGIIYPYLRLVDGDDEDFGPYTEETYTVSLSSAGTVYHGELNVKTGVLTVTHGVSDIADSASVVYTASDKRWNISAPSNTKRLTYRYGDIVSENYKTDINASAGDVGLCFYAFQTFYVYDPVGDTQPTGKYTYPLATPTTYHLTPHQVSLLKGYNRITSDEQNTLDVTYREGTIATLEDIPSDYARLSDIPTDYATLDDIPTSRIESLEEDVSTLKNRVPIYGFCIDESKTDPAEMVTYTDDAVGMTPFQMNLSTGVPNYGSWKDAFFMPRPCHLRSDGVVDYYLNPDDFTIDEAGDDISGALSDSEGDGNFMMEWPIIYVSRTSTSDPWTGVKHYTKISPLPIDSSYHAWCNLNINGDLRPFYTPIHNGSLIDGKLRSLSGQDIMQSKTTEQERTYAKANGDGWDIEYIGDRMLINDLLFLMGKSLNIRAVYGNGFISGGSANNFKKTGTLDKKGLFYGLSSTDTPVKVFGMENYWGQQWRRQLGWLVVNTVVKMKFTLGKQDGSTVDGYNLTGEGYLEDYDFGSNGTSGDYISGCENTKFGLIPSSNTGASSTTKYCVGYWYNFNYTGIICAFVGGLSTDGVKCGALYSDLGDRVGYAGWSIGAAPSYKPTA